MRSCPRCRSIYVSNAEFCGVDGERVVETTHDPLLGGSIDRYAIKEWLGRGGMASVYRGTHEVLGRDQAIKLLHGEMASDRKFTERFRREAQTMAKIIHPNVIKVVDFGVTQEGLHFLVMELLDGITLQELLKKEGPLSPARAANILSQIASGLQVAHEIGFVHRDLKPANVMILEDDGKEHAKILDFGLVRIAYEAEEDATQLTRAGVTMGTPPYMAPEQIRAGIITAKSDLYSLGVVLYEMLSGAPPYRGSLPEIIVQQAQEKRRPLVPAGGLEELAAGLLSKEPNERPKSAAEVVERIDRLGGLGDLYAKRAPDDTRAERIDRIPRMASRVPRRSSRKVWPWIVISILVVTAGGLGFVLKEPEKARTIEGAVLVPAKTVVRELKEATHVTSAAAPATHVTTAAPQPQKIRVKHPEKVGSRSVRIARKSSRGR